MEFWAVPYLIIYGLFFFAWLVRTNKQIMFWLYLWQLKEYHLGRFLSHFSTTQGRSIFFNKLFGVKLVLFFWGLAIALVPAQNRAFFDYSDQYRLVTTLFLVFLAVVFVVEAVWTVRLFFLNRLLHPGLTKKSVMLIAATHSVFFAAALAVYLAFLGEMSLIDLCLAGLVLLSLDVFAPIIISAIVLGLQPLTIIEKDKILKNAFAVIGSRPDLITIGIAGSYGKSVTKELLAHILSKKYRVLKTPANQNTEIGMAQTVNGELKPEHEVFVCEIGAVHKGRIRQVANIVKPKIGILTGINQQHLAVFGSQKNIIEAKYEILESLPSDGTAVLNYQSAGVVESFAAQLPLIKAGKKILVGKDIKICEIEAKIDSLGFDIDLNGQIHQIRTNARGAYMVEPIVLAIAGAVSVGMDPTDAVETINKTDFGPFNICIFQNSSGLNVISSTYSSNPDGVLGHLDYLKLWPGKKAIVIPCLIELGSVSTEVHFEIGKKIGQVCGLVVVTTKERFNDIKKGAESAGMNPENIVFCEKTENIDRLIKNRLTGGDTILLEGRLVQSIIDIIKK